jgi:hypothetical protein
VTLRLSQLEEYLTESMGTHLVRAHRAGACPDELLAAVAIMYYRYLHEYAASGAPVEIPLRVGQRYHEQMYLAGAEVV